MKTTQDVRVKWLSIAKDAARSAGDALADSSGFKSNVKVNSEARRDIKLSADIHSERIILNILKDKTKFSILSEESGLEKHSNSDYTWIIDPLDGTLNYARGIPISCVSIGLWQGEEPILGVVYEFGRDELYAGIAGEGAWLNNSPLVVSAESRKEKSILCTGFPINTDFAQDRIREFVESVRSYKKVRLLGSAALSIAYVAAAKVEAYHEKDIMLWDVAGAIPIALGAGGYLKMERSSKKNCYNVFVSNGKI